MIIFYSGADNHMKVVPETVLDCPAVMMTYVELSRIGGGGGREQ